MKLEAFSETNSKKKFIVIFTIICIALVVGVFLYHSYAWYEDEKVFNSFNGNVTPVEDLYFSIYVDGVASTTVPSNTSNYNFDHAECTNGASITWDDVSWAPIITNITSTRTKCTLYFASSPSASSTLAKLQALNSNLVLNTSMNSTSGTCPVFNTTTKTIQTTSGERYASLLCEAEDDYGTTYYFRGNVTNNYVSFAGSLWRIIRINGDGSIRIMKEGSIGKSSFNNATFSEMENAHAGYMYKNLGQSTYQDTFDVMNNKNANSSAIKQTIDTWYVNNILNQNYAEFLSDTLFCNDKNFSAHMGEIEGDYYNSDVFYRWYDFPWGGYYGDIQYPRFTCVNQTGYVDSKNDAYTVSDTIHGNASLNYPIATTTLDEVISAGGWDENAGTEGTTYMARSTSYNTLSSRYFEDESLYVQQAYQSGNTSSDTESRTNDEFEVYPVVNLKASVNLTGSGTSTDPFTINNN